MNNERAIELLHRLQDEQFDGQHGDERLEALEMAVRALSGEGDTIYRQDAIDAIDAIFPVAPMKTEYAQGIACGAALAKTYIKQLPPAQPKVLACGNGELVQESDSLVKDLVKDCISRQAAIDAVAKWFYDVFGITKSDGTATIFKRLRELPSAQPERKKGRWINNSPVTMKCDQCGYVIKDWKWNELNFCANCGADMRGEKDEVD